MCMEGSAVLQHTVSDAQFCQDVFGLGGVFLQLAADVGHVDSKDLVVIVHVGAPDGIHDVTVGQDSAGILCLKCEQLVLNLGQMHLFTPQADQSFLEIYLQIQCLIYMTGSLGVAVPQRSADPCHELAGAERF